MSTSGNLIPTIEDVKVEIRETFRNPNIGKTHQFILKKGPRVFRIATIFEILNAKTGELHHHTLKLDVYEQTANGFLPKPDKSSWITSEPGELEKLHRFITGVIEGYLPDEAGSFHIVDDSAYQNIENLAPLVNRANLNDRLSLIQRILDDISAAEFEAVEYTKANEDLLENIAVAARMAQYRRVYEDFERMVNDESISELAIQNILSENPWLFGSEYSELLERRSWTRDDRLDFMLRRAVDGYLEIIEIKTPFTGPLLRHDTSHDSFYPSSALSKVIGQVIRYIDEVERHRDSIIAHDGDDPLKIRARVIIGRDGDLDQQEALRNLNAHLYRIEVLTFDQLLRIGGRVLNVFKETIGGGEIQTTVPAQEEDEIPF